MKTTEETIDEIKALFEHNKKLSGKEFAVLKPIAPYDDVDWELVKTTFSPVVVQFFTEIQTIFIEK